MYLLFGKKTGRLSSSRAARFPFFYSVIVFSVWMRGNAGVDPLFNGSELGLKIGNLCVFGIDGRLNGRRIVFNGFIGSTG